MSIYKLLGFTTALALGSAAIVGVATPVSAGAPEITATQTSASYKVELDIGPAALMLTPEQAATATSGELMVDTSNMAGGMNMGSMAMPMPDSAVPMAMMQMATTDDGQPVNHHLEVHIHDKSTGAVVADSIPMIMITDKATGASETLNDVMGMYDIQVGMSDLHFGNNVYLKDGDPYTIQAMVGPETVTFANVPISCGMGLAGDAMGSMGAMGGMTMPGLQPAPATP